LIIICTIPVVITDLKLDKTEEKIAVVLRSKLKCVFSLQAEIHMVENKEESLARARERGVQLGLNNVWFYQSNMGYYQVKNSKYIIGKGSPTGAQQCLVLSIQHGLLSGKKF
jgi:hypothetical protein